MKKNIFPGALIFFTALFFIFPDAVLAASVAVSSPASTYPLGETFTATVRLETGGVPVNAVSGKISVSKETAEIVDVRSGASILSLWVEKPTISRSSNTVSFSGGVPGGFSGSSGGLFTLVLRGKSIGTVVIRASEIEVLKNDGLGSSLPGVEAGSLTLSITEPKPKQEAAVTETEIPTELVVALDATPPEPFLPLISSHETIYDGSYFVAFNAIDKGAGIDRYEVLEEPVWIPALRDSAWVSAESPYRLSRQLWKTKVTVRAYDRDGNVRESYAIKPFHPGLVSGLLALSALLVVTWLRRYPVKSARPSRKRVVK